MRESTRKLIERWAQQVYLPGMEAEEDAPRRPEEQTSIERNVDIEKEWAQTAGRGEQPAGRGEQLRLNPHWVPSQERPKKWKWEIQPSGEYRLPLPSSFPELDVNSIEKIMHTSEEGQRIRESSDWNKLNKETRDRLEKQIFGPNSQFSLPAEEALKLYNEFRKLYTEYFKNYLEIYKLLKAGRSTEIFQNIKGLPLKSFLFGTADYLANALVVELGRESGTHWAVPWLGPILANLGKTKLEPIKLVDATKNLEYYIKIYRNSIKLLENAEYGIKRQIMAWLEVPNNLKLLSNVDRESIEHSILEVVNSQVKYFDFRHSILKIMSGEATAEKIYRDMAKPIILAINQAINNHTFNVMTEFRKLLMSHFHKKLSQLQKDINTATKNYTISPINTEDEKKKLSEAYDKVKEPLSKYFDIDGLEKTFNFGIFSQNKGKISEDEKLAFKAYILDTICGLSNSQEGIDTLGAETDPRIRDRVAKLSPQNLQEKLNEISEREADESLKKKIVNCVARQLEWAKSDLWSRTSTWYEETLKDTDFTGIGKAFSHLGDFKPRTLINKFVDEATKIGLPESSSRTFAKMLLREGHYRVLAKWASKRIPPPYIIIFTVLQREAAKKGSQIAPEKMLRIITEGSIPMSFRGYGIPAINARPEIIASGIHSMETLDRDLKNLDPIMSLIHNNAAEIKPNTLKQLLGHRNIVFSQSRDIAWKFSDLIIKILGAGGISSFKKKYLSLIKLATERGIIKPGFNSRLTQVGRIFLDNKEINPSKPNFQEVKKLVLETASEVDLIIEYQDFAEYYNQAEPKNPNVFKLNLKLSPTLRFRVLQDLDPYHFKVGGDTDCCQSPGGVGRMAMVDSFINPLAGVLVLENKKDNKWETVAQSYFHWVPQDKGYILDNVEVNPRYKDQDFYVKPYPSTFTIEQLYAYWAAQKEKELKLPQKLGKGYILAGLGYSDIDTGSFGRAYLDQDPRSFKVDNPYTDWEAHRSMDLTDSKLAIPILQVERTANVYDKIYKLAIEFQQNLKEYLEQNPQQYQVMEEVEEDSFKKYHNVHDFDQDAEDIEDDFNQPGIAGVGVTDNAGNMVGYVYGYNMTTDEMPEINLDMLNQELAKQYGIRFYTQVPEGFAKHVYQLMNEGKVFYVANLALPKYKIKLAKMLKELLDKLRQAGYEYVTFDALSDATKLFLSDDRTPRESRMAMFGVQLVAMIPDEGGWEHAQAILKI